MSEVKIKDITGKEYCECVWDILYEYRLSLKAANRSHKTITWYMDILKRYFAFLKSNNLVKQVQELRTGEPKAYVLHLQNSTRWPNNPYIIGDRGKLSAHTVQGHVRAIKAFWGWLFKEGYIEENPLSKFPLPTVPHYVIKTLTSDHIRKLLSAIDKSTPSGAKYYCILMIFLENGMRLSELVNIKMNDLDLAHGLVTVLGKGQKERTVPFTKWTRRELFRYIHNFRRCLCSEDSPYLFPKSDGTHISAGSVQQYMRRLVKKAGLEGIKCSPHIFRHTFATLAIANEANVYAVKDIMGHASLQTTMKYTHLQVGDLKNQHNRFSPVEGLMKDKS